ncbi:hypothetical protein [Nocardia amamiensis]|uniref:hypothetical protein n=1 Tax=Nocardia amamiensis TaxID=404578 RepID=UPI00082DDB8A|nr:hypothetical protein [Nocardia amamiensis]
MLIATLIITTAAIVRRWFGRRASGADSAERRPAGSVRQALRRPVPVAATVVTLLGIAVAAGTLTQC